VEKEGPFRGLPADGIRRCRRTFGAARETMARARNRQVYPEMPDR
jgi:hypothetical protein